MNIETKFSLNDKAYSIVYGPVRSSQRSRCPTCLGTTRVTLNNESFDCPKCDGRGDIFDSPPSAWRVTGLSTVVRLSAYRGWVTSNNEERGVQYVVLIDGCHHSAREEDLFATAEEAQAECSRRNASKEPTP